MLVVFRSGGNELGMYDLPPADQRIAILTFRNLDLAGCRLKSRVLSDTVGIHGLYDPCYRIYFPLCSGAHLNAANEYAALHWWLRGGLDDLGGSELGSSACGSPFYRYVRGGALCDLRSWLAVLPLRCSSMKFVASRSP